MRTGNGSGTKRCCASFGYNITLLNNVITYLGILLTSMTVGGF